MRVYMALSLPTFSRGTPPRISLHVGFGQHETKGFLLRLIFRFIPARTTKPPRRQNQPVGWLLCLLTRGSGSVSPRKMSRKPPIEASQFVLRSFTFFSFQILVMKKKRENVKDIDSHNIDFFACFSPFHCRSKEGDFFSLCTGCSNALANRYGFVDILDILTFFFYFFNKALRKFLKVVSDTYSAKQYRSLEKVYSY